MIKTYFIAGYAIKQPYLNKDMQKKVEKCPELYDKLSRIMCLVFIDEENILLKQIFKIKQGVIYHRYSKRTNWYKFTHAVLRLKDNVKILLSDRKDIELFVGKYISYNTITKKWVFTNDKLKKPIKLTKTMKDFIAFNLNIKFKLLHEVFEEN